MKKNQRKRNPTAQEDRFWREHISQYKKSNLSKRAYAKEKELSYQRFLHWYHQIEKSSNPELIPINISRETRQEVPFCTLENNQGQRLLIHDLALAKSLLSGF